MSDQFQPIPMEQLAAWIFGELEARDSIFGIPQRLFFVPGAASSPPGGSDPFATEVYGQRLETPFGVAAGPHSQMAQNIIAAWLCGARFIELKTVQTLDELTISKPCIDMQDEGYNVEWSQELKVEESFDEYVRAWILIHALHHKLGFPGTAPGVVFNMSVGYNMEGLLKPNMQWYLRSLRDAGELRDRYAAVVARHYPAVLDLAIPGRVSDNVTLSTMHGCPPDEIEKISEYLMREWGLHTSVKLNPTLLGPQALRNILNGVLGYKDIVVPDAAFEHDLKYAAAAPMLARLREAARTKGVEFGAKLSNTLEVENHRSVFAAQEKRMYLSGRPLHAVTVGLAAKLSEEFGGGLPMSFAGGADAFHVADLLRCGMRTITVCSDILRMGGYLRLRQYLENTMEAMNTARAAALPDYICKTARRAKKYDAVFDGWMCEVLKPCPGVAVTKDACKDLARLLIRAPGTSRAESVVRGWAAELALTEKADEILDRVVRVCARINLSEYAADVLADRTLRQGAYARSRTKTFRPLGLFDCIKAPCTDECPVDQKVPQYMNLVRQGRYDEAVDLARDDNPLPSILGRACNHLCEEVCVRTHLDEPLAIREIKRFIMAQEQSPHFRKVDSKREARIAVIGGGPCGLSVAYFLGQAGYPVTIFEARPYAGGMVSGTIPAYRAAQAVIDQDLEIIQALGGEIRLNQRAGKDFTLAGLREQGFKYVVVATGAQQGRKLGVEGENAAGVLDALDFLRSVKEEKPLPLGRRIGVIGGGDVAMDCARSAWRLTGSKIMVIYRRTVDQMPADREEIEGVLDEGIEVVELAKPLKVLAKGGKVTGLECLRMKLGDKDSSGRRRPVDVPGSEFTVKLDTLIVAISQEPSLDFLGGEPVKRTKDGYLDVDSDTFETSLPGVYAGGDIALEGPASIVKALGDGRKIAESIRCREEGIEPSRDQVWVPADVDVVELMRRKAHRKFRVPIPHLPAASRRNFDEVTKTLPEDVAREEAARCLDCHLFCSLCVGVCPNLAFMTYRVEPFQADLPEMRQEGGQLVPGAARPFRVDQWFQVAVLTDFCNECGNCVTFCPTAGRPYKDKPRLYLRRSEFEAEPDNAFMITRKDGTWKMEARFAGATHELEVGDEITYVSPKLRARLDRNTFALKEAVPTEQCAVGETVGLEECAKMYVLLTGLRTSMPHLPAAV
ncbi:MAG: FAD-dependent oxidoreductase [Verrucomicrobiota bacterium]